MRKNWISSLGWVAISLAILAGIIGIGREVASYRGSGVVDWGHVALSFGVPVLMYAIVRGTSTRG